MREKKGSIYGNIVGAIVMISLGIIFLLNNFGVLPWSVWGTLWRLWPIFLIIPGIQLIIGNSKITSIFVALITGFFIIFLLIIYSISNLDPNWVDNNASWIKSIVPDITSTSKNIKKEFLVSQKDFTGINSRKLDLNIGSAEFKILDKDSKDYLKIQSSFPESLEPIIKTNSSDNELKIDFSTASRKNFGWFNDYSNFEFEIGELQLETSIDLTLGSGNGKINFDNLNLKNFTLNQGSGDMEVEFLNEKQLPKILNFKLGSGNIKLVLSEDTNINVSYEIGSGNLTVNGKKIDSKQGEYSSIRRDDIQNRTSIEIEMGSGNFEIVNK